METQVDNDKINRKFNWELIKQPYLVLRQMTDIVNDIIWPNILIRTVHNFVFYAFNIDALLASTDITRRLRILVFFINACWFSYLGADILYKVSILSYFK